MIRRVVVLVLFVLCALSSTACVIKLDPDGSTRACLDPPNDMYCVPWGRWRN